jgi:serine/threonine-protein kinase
MSAGRLGKYEILQELGAGAMGVVYLAYDPAIDRNVAVKTIRKDHLDAAASSQAVARFRREAMAAGRLTHPGIVAIYDYGEDERVAYIVMEYAPGEELGRYAARQPLGLSEIGIIMSQLLDALEYAHRAGVVHRDVKPSNILLAGRVKVADFGIAHIAHIARSQLTQTGIVMGTPAYMAPEQYRGVGVDHRVDLFASGVIFYQLLTGAPPFAGDSIAEVAYKICHMEPVPATRVRPGLPPAVDTVLAKALAKDKDARYPNAGELSRAILAALASDRGDGAGANADVRGEPIALESAATVVAGAPPATAVRSRAPTRVTPEALDRITQTLAKYVGPIARVMIKKVGADATTYQDLCMAVSARLTADERSRFLRELGIE